MKSELDWGLILYGEEEEDYLATTEGGSCVNYDALADAPDDDDDCNGHEDEQTTWQP